MTIGPRHPRRTLLFSASGVVLLSTCLSACADRPGSDGDPPPGARGAPFARTEVREDCADYEPLRKPLFGDLHVHTRFSADAYTYGTRVGPREAYAFARGAEISLADDDEQQTRSARIDRPIDFSAVTDHAEFFGEVDLCSTPGSAVYDEMLCEQLRAVEHPDDRFIVTVAWLYPAGIPNPPRSHTFCLLPGIDCDASAVSVWREMQVAAEEAYDRSASCSFTTFLGYEHTTSPVGRHMHRNVIFRNAVVPEFPASHLETWQDGLPQGIWTAIERDCVNAGTGCDAVIIPHNPNLSGGRQLADPIDAADAARRREREPIIEIFQIKSSSECRFDRLLGRGVGTEDELCTFEHRDLAHEGPDEGPPPTDLYPRRNMVRNALKDGLALENQLGANPFQMGFIGSTDTHDATAGLTPEAGWPGAHGNGDSSPGRQINGHRQDNPGGLAVTWAEENSRDAIFAALERRETYATSGTRPVLRFFAGELDGVACDRGDAVRRAYATGVPMGGELGGLAAGRNPRFLVLASKDPGTPEAPGSDLQRAQIVKGWVDEAGVTHERVFDVAGRSDGPTGDAAVDPETCAPRVSGVSDLCTVWEDPEFVPGQRAFYYVRLLETPTCRWSTLLCKSQGVDPFSPRCAEQAAAVSSELADCCIDPAADPYFERVIQERSWSSPIWVQPDGIARLSGVIDGAGAGDAASPAGSIELELDFGVWPRGVDPTRDPTTLRMHDDESLLDLTVAPESWTGDASSRRAVVGDGKATLVLETRADGSARLQLSARGVDVSGVDPVEHEFAVELTSGVYRSIHRRRWSIDDRRLSTRAAGGAE